MRNAVIRKKVLREQAMFRKYMFTPQRLIVPASMPVDWTNEPTMRRNMLGMWALDT